ncbi:MAG: hypothetical protein Q7R78_01935, partial [bacterium]|nr:hypothetical protein [bacterium]
MDPPLAEVEKLFLFAVDQITDSVYAEKKFKFYLDAIKLRGLEQSLAMVKAYYACESGVMDKVKLRQDIRQKININLLDPYLRIIFLPELEQLLLLYEVFSKTLAEYLTLNLGKERVSKIISSQRSFPLIKEVIVLDDSFDFSKLNKILYDNKDLKKKDIEDLFSYFYHSLLTEISVLFGESTVSSLVKKTFEIVKSFYDFDIISLFLNIIPESDLEEERLAFLSRDELEAKVHERTFLLKKEKELVDQKVKERTGELIEEKVKLAIITENMNEGVILLDESYTVMYINP